MTDKLTGAAGRQYVTDAIRHSLRSGDLVPGQRLVENDLAESYGTTRSAVREALQDLAAEEIVEIVPRRGARIRAVSIDEAIQITECRSALEQLCAMKAATQANEAQRTELRRIGTEMRQAVADGAVHTYSALNQRLHELVVEASGQEVARRQLERLNGPMVRFQFRLALRPGRPAQSLAAAPGHHRRDRQRRRHGSGTGCCRALERRDRTTAVVGRHLIHTGTDP